MSNKILIATAFGLLLGWSLTEVHAANPTPNRLRTEFTGPEKCLDIINDGLNNTPIMATCGNFSGQAWTILPAGTRGYYKLRTEFTGPDKCLDIEKESIWNASGYAKDGTQVDTPGRI